MRGQTQQAHTQSCSHAPIHTLRHTHTDTHSHTPGCTHMNTSRYTLTHISGSYLHFHTDTPTHVNAHPARTLTSMLILTLVYTLSTHNHIVKHMQTHTCVHTTPISAHVHNSHVFSRTQVPTRSQMGRWSLQGRGYASAGVCWGSGASPSSQASMTHCFLLPTSYRDLRRFRRLNPAPKQEGRSLKIITLASPGPGPSNLLGTQGSVGAPGPVLHPADRPTTLSLPPCPCSVPAWPVPPGLPRPLPEGCWAGGHLNNFLPKAVCHPPSRWLLG